MPKVEESFEELRNKLRQNEHLIERSAESIYYLVFSPQEMQTVKRKLPTWKAKLENVDGWHVEVLSLAVRIQDTIRNHKRMPDWLEYERLHPGDYQAVRGTLVDLFTKPELIDAWIRESLEAAATRRRGLVVVTDIEAIHPFLRIGAVEIKLQGKCPVPLVILYPGVRTGQTVLRFLGEYPEDGNYRSLMIGG
jgi:hypothetical protein